MFPKSTTTLSLLPLLVLVPFCQAVWPIPREITTGNTTMFIDQTVKVTYNGKPVCWPSSADRACTCARPQAESPALRSQEHTTEFSYNLQMSYTAGYSPAPGPAFNSADIVQGAVSRSLDAIFRQNFVPWMLRPRGSKDPEPNLLSEKTWVKTLTITQNGTDTDTTFRPLAGDVDESYSLNITEAGDATIAAATSTGVLHALGTFVQLFYQHTSGTSWYTRVAPVRVADKPKYAHRGLLFDAARSWFPVDDILRTIDAMSWNKLNRFHLHVTDSQSWPLEIPSMPELAEKGAYAKGLTYSPTDLAKIQEYCVHRGIEPIVEIDMPGHSGAVALSFPDLIVAYNEMPYGWYCAEPPCGSFKLNNTAVFAFLDKLWDDLLPRLSPYSSYFHTGGDEYNRNNSILDEGIKSNDSALLQPLLQHFLDKVHHRVRSEKMTPVVWEEMYLDWNATLGHDVLVQTWLGGNSVRKLIAAGYKVVDSNYNFWYLDCGRGQWLNSDNGKSFNTYYPFNDWCNPQKSWRLIYTYDPRQAAGVEGAQAELIVGGEAALWTETIDPAILDSVLWPRLSAVAEVLWSGRQDAAGNNRTQFDAGPRLADMRERMLGRGVAASPVHMPFCTQNSPEACSI